MYRPYLYLSIFKATVIVRNLRACKKDTWHLRIDYKITRMLKGEILLNGVSEVIFRFENLSFGSKIICH